MQLDLMFKVAYVQFVIQTNVVHCVKVIKVNVNKL